MRQRGDSQGKGRSAAAIAAALAIACLSLLGASSAEAAFEQVGCFAGGIPGEPCKPVSGEKFSEEVQLGGVGGMAVNYTGAGGVPKGTVYAMTETNKNGPAVVMFAPSAGGLRFEEAWEVTEAEGPYERCGPRLGVDGEGKAEVPCQTRVKSLAGRIDVDVDQATGNVYVHNGTITAGRNAIVAYKADGSAVLARFGELAPGSEEIAASPGKIHGDGIPFPGSIAVNGAGEVYVFDRDVSAHYRLAKFKPKVAGKFDEYEYAAGADLAAGQSGHRPTKPVTDKAGNVYVASEEAFIEEYDPASPGAGPVCSFKYAPGGITALAVDPLSGAVFFFSFKVPKRVHELGPCNEATGKFEGPKGEAEVGQIEVSPERDDLGGMAFDPGREFSAGRPAGTLYGGAPGPVPSGGVGEGEPGQSSLGYIFAPAKESPPEVSGESVSGVRATSARLGAVVSPKAFKTHYIFEYLSEAEYQAAGESFEEAAEAPLGGAFVPGGAPQTVGVNLSGLAPDTEYRFRVVATSEGCPSLPGELCEVAGASKLLRTYPPTPAGLPDNRAYELVSPAEKQGGQVLPADPRVYSCGAFECKPGTFAGRFPMQSAPGGDAIAYEGTPFGPGGASLENEYIARRDPSAGWQTVNPSPTLMFSKGGQGYRAFTEDLSEALLLQAQPSLTPQAPSEYENIYAQPSTSPFALRPIISTGMHRSASEFRLTYTGASADLSRVFFAANDALTPEVLGIAPEAVDGGAAKFNLYEWERATGQLRLVNVGPGNATTEPGASFGPGSAHAISDDGSRAFWSDQAGKLFVREDADKTREIPGSGASAKFLAAALDGSRVLLSNGSVYDLDEGTTTDLTGGEGGFLGLVGQSDDLSHVYFVDTKVLTGAEENCRESLGAEVCEAAQAGKVNLYDWVGGTTRFVATLLATDNDEAVFNLTADWAVLPSGRTAQASPHGRYLAFLSRAPLSGYDNTGPCKFEGSESLQVPCVEVFLYDSETGELTCPSCNPSGAATLGHSMLRLLDGPSWLPQPRYLFDSGRLYFDSQESLSPLDTNEGVEDVYELEPNGVGSCTRSGGCISLISAGREGVDSNFFAADASAKNVFFTTRDRLVAADTDQLLDLYDAREFGGFASEAQLPPGPCSGEGCQLPAPASPEAPPASATFTGPGNVKPPKGCKKGEVKKKGKCVKKKKGGKAKNKKAKRGSR